VRVQTDVWLNELLLQNVEVGVQLYLRVGTETLLLHLNLHV
jgi:hypothetical protein